MRSSLLRLLLIALPHGSLAGIFIAEMVIKVIGFGKQYFFDPWNQVDFAIVCISIWELSPLAGGYDVTLFRIFRVTRILKLVKGNQGLKSLVFTLVTSIPALGNVGGLIALLLFMFAVMGMNLFGLEEQDGIVLHEYCNFQSFSDSMLTLFRVLTGESWPDIMHELMHRNNLAAPAFFIAFSVLAQFTLLSLFVAVILEEFETLMTTDNQQDTLVKERESTFTMFMKAWQEVDPKYDFTIPSYKVVALLYALDPPLGFKGLKGAVYTPNSDSQRTANVYFLVDHVKSLGIVVQPDGRIHCLEVLAAFMEHQTGTEVDMATLKEDDIIQLGATLSTMVQPSVKSKLSAHTYSRQKKCGSKCCGGVGNDGSTEPPAALDIADYCSSATHLQRLYRAKRAREAWLKYVRSLSPSKAKAMEHLLYYTLPSLARNEQERKQHRISQSGQNLAQQLPGLVLVASQSPRSGYRTTPLGVSRSMSVNE